MHTQGYLTPFRVIQDPAHLTKHRPSAILVLVPVPVGPIGPPQNVGPDLQGCVVVPVVVDPLLSLDPRTVHRLERRVSLSKQQEGFGSSSRTLGYLTRSCLCHLRWLLVLSIGCRLLLLGDAVCRLCVSRLATRMLTPARLCL